MRGAGKWAAQRTQAERREARRNIHLADVAIQPSTQTRYYNGLRQILPLLEETSQIEDLDDVIAEWVEFQFEDGTPLFSISDTLSALHHFLPITKGKLVRSWKLFSVWRRYEVPMRAPPMTNEVLLGIAGKAFTSGDCTFATLIVLGFHTMMRTHEMLAVEPGHFLLGETSGIVTMASSKSGV